jgi:hypothetical protein
LVSHFLRGLFEDGTVNVCDGVLDHVCWDSIFPRLVNEVRTLLLYQGISVSTVNRSKGGSALCLYGSNVDIFASRIGFVSSWKNARLNLPRRPETYSTLPISKGEASEMRHTFKDIVGVSSCQNAMNRGYISVRDARLIAGAGRGTLSDTMMERLGWVHERVASVVEVQAPSVCVEVPEGHQFLQNGFSGWNSQGLEYDCIIMPLMDSFRGQLQRNLLYTAVTRAKHRVFLVGTKTALVAAVRNDKEDQRNTLFRLRLGNLIK